VSRNVSCVAERILVIACTLVLASCGGGKDSGLGDNTQPPGPPFISASLINFPAASTPAGFSNGASVQVLDDFADPIPNASVTLSGIALPYNALNGDYEGNVVVPPGGAITLNVTVNGHTYTASGTQFTSFPTISTPPAGGAWSLHFNNVIGWSGGAPVANATYAIGVLDAADPNGNVLWPVTGLDLEPIGTTSVTIPAEALTTPGNRLAVVGIASLLNIPGAATDSSLVIGGFNYVPIEVTNATISLLSLSVAPSGQVFPNQLLAFAKGATQQFAATGTFATSLGAGNLTIDVTGSVAWSSSNPTKATIDSKGLATGVADGPITITATMDPVTGSTLLPTSGSTAAVVVAGFQTALHDPGISSTMRLTNTAVGDLDGDGRNDVAVLEESGSRVLVYHQTAQGTLDPPQTITTDLLVRAVAIADVNSDGLADLIVSGNSTTATSGFVGRIAIFLQDSSNHTLTGPQELIVSTNNVGPVAVADLNGDSRPDVASVGTGSGGNGVISLFFQDIHGALGAEVPLTNFPVLTDGDTQVGDMHVADMNNDGLNDIVLQSDLTQLAVIKQGPAGTFSTAPDFYTVQPNPWFRFETLALADLNGDGLTDVATSSANGDVNIFYQNGSGTLTGPTLMPAVGFEVHIADLDGDGLNDLVVSGGTAATILYQAADHSFLSPLSFSFNTFSTGGTIVHQAMSIGDVTGDGLPDIVASWLNEGVFVLPRTP
jgi:Bacterial Ig-like domain (group 2)/FG-GAP-like repeat